MKKKFFKYVPMILGLAVAFTSCSKDDDEKPQSPFVKTNPEVDYLITVNGIDMEENQTSYAVTVDDEVFLHIHAVPGAEGKNLATLQLTKPSNAALIFNSEKGNTYTLITGVEEDIKSAENKNLIGSASLGTESIGAKTYAIAFNDKDGNSTTISFDLTVAEEEGDPTPLATTKNGTVYHIEGSFRGSWNLLTDQDVSSSNNGTAHIINTDGGGEGFSGSFEVGDESGADFVLVDGSFDYDNATEESAAAAYGAGTQTTSASPDTDEVYIFNIDGEYVVVKILSIEPENDDCGCDNLGAMKFEYKKN